MNKGRKTGIRRGGGGAPGRAPHRVTWACLPRPPMGTPRPHSAAAPLPPPHSRQHTTRKAPQGLQEEAKESFQELLHPKKRREKNKTRRRRNEGEAPGRLFSRCFNYTKEGGATKGGDCASKPRGEKERDRSNVRRDTPMHVHLHGLSPPPPVRRRRRATPEGPARCRRGFSPPRQCGRRPSRRRKGWGQRRHRPCPTCPACRRPSRAWS